MLTPQTLGISIKERNALVRVRDGLMSGGYMHIRRLFSENQKRNTKGRRMFNMMVSADVHKCGTVACIGGWAAVEMKRDPIVYVLGASGGLHDLFYPPVRCKDVYKLDDIWERITPKQAARAIDNFLDYGDPKWTTVIRG